MFTAIRGIMNDYRNLGQFIPLSALLVGKVGVTCTSFPVAASLWWHASSSDLAVERRVQR